MKKMLTLVLILAMASWANAITFTGAYNPGTGKVSVTCTADPEMYNIGLSITSGGGALSNFAKGTNAPADSASAYTMGPGQDFEGYGVGEVWAMVHLTTGEQIYVTGEWLTADFTGSKPSVATFYQFTEDNGGTFYSLGTILIPEPITMSLLGLGGLFLRRRK